MILNSCS